MRFILLVLVLGLASCATPKTAPNSFTEGVYTPGKPVVENDGRFVSQAAVHSEDDIALARKAAWMRLMALAEAEGYGWFAMRGETVDKLLLHRVTVSGQLFTGKPEGRQSWPVAQMRRLSQGLPPIEERPVASAVTARTPAQLAAARTVERSASGAGTSEATRLAVQEPATPILDPNGVPVGFQPVCLTEGRGEDCGNAGSEAPEALEATGASGEVEEPVAPETVIEEEPIVIMAPEDITGSVKRAGTPSRPQTVAPAATKRSGRAGDAVSGIPSGVIYRR